MVVSILNKVSQDLFDYYLNPNTTVELPKKLECDTIDSILKKYSKHGSPVDEIIDKIEMPRNVKATLLEESIAERVRLRKQKAETLKRLTVEKVKTEQKD